MNFDAIIRSIKGLALSAIENANSGHTSFPLGMAEVGCELFFNQINFFPQQPKWINRDRLVLSSGHGSMFLYSFLHLFQYPISITDIRNFRQLNSNTPGHPEFHITEGVECTTGPLGQGVSNAVGIALSEKMLSAQFNTDKHKVFDHYTFCLCGDGDLMEGISMEAISFAGHYRLSKLICIYDSNSITIDGPTNLTYTENVSKKLNAQNWYVQKIDGHSISSIHHAINNAKKSSRPSFIIAKTTSGKGALRWEGSNQIHGNPMKKEDYDATFKSLRINRFEVLKEAYDEANVSLKKKKRFYRLWEQSFSDWKIENPTLSKRLKKMIQKKNMALINKIHKFSFKKEGEPTRTLNGELLNEISEQCEEFIGGSADLASSNNTIIHKSSFISSRSFCGKNIHFGIREHAMAGIMNGIAYSGIFRAYGGTFLVFSDYMRPAIRMAALSRLPVLYIFTHDSFYVGEDGPTHHPIEQLSSLRLIPNLITFRPADGDELKSCWRVILSENTRPIALCLTRQNIPQINRTIYSKSEAEKGAYILKKEKKTVKYLFIASGSEVALLLKTLEKLDIMDESRIISMPSTNIFDEQPKSYQEKILPPSVHKRFAIEAAKTDLWWKYVGLSGYVFGLDHYSKSAPYKSLEKIFGFTVENLSKKISAYIAQ